MCRRFLFGDCIHVPAAGDATWLTPDLRNDPAVQSAGLLVKHNACFEGLVQLAPGDFLLAAERDPRGLVEVDLSRQPPAVSAVKMKRSPHAEEGGRKPDFADLAVWRGRVFALVRNLSLVCELVRDPSSKKGWRVDMTAGVVRGVKLRGTTGSRADHHQASVI